MSLFLKYFFKASQARLATLPWVEISFFLQISFSLGSTEQPGGCGKGSVQGWSLHAATACCFLSAVLLALPLSFSTPSLSLHSFPLSPHYLYPFSMLSSSLSLGFPLCFSSLISLCSYPALGHASLFLVLLLLYSLSLLDAPSAPLCSWVPFCSANTSCLVFLAVQQMFPQCCGGRRTKGSFHFSCGMERDCTAGLRGRRSGGSHAYIQTPRQPEH